MSTRPKYKIRAISEDDTEAVLNHLRRFFYKNEPLNDAVNLSSSCIDLDNFCMTYMHGGISYVTVTDNDEIISVILNTIYDIQDHEEDELEYTDPKFMKVGKFVEYVGANGTQAIKEKYPDCRKTFDVKVLSTDSEFRGNGLATQLVQLSRQTAYDNKCDLMRIDCSSLFSARLAEKIGFTLVYELLYSDYKKEGKMVFASVPHPHTSATTYVQKLSAP